MPAPANPFKKALKEGKTQIGCWLSLANPFTTEMIGTAGFDWLLIDNEHAPNDLRSTHQQLQVLQSSGSHAVVRVPIGETYIIKQMLDAGAQSILVPMVESAEQARELVRDVTYPPTGRRGVGYSLARASKFGTITDYGKTADAEICLLVQVENRAGLAELDAILEVDGVDGVFIGPADLAADLGHMGDIHNPEIQATIIDALKRIRAAGKAPGILATQETMARNAIEAGAQFVAVGTDTLLLTSGARTLVKSWLD